MRLSASRTSILFSTVAICTVLVLGDRGFALPGPSPLWQPFPASPVSASADEDDPLIQDLRWRNIGNANLKGRISSIDALEGEFSTVVVGTASGGVWKATNAGTTWTPIFDSYGSASIGEVRISQNNPDIIWVGTGEKDGRNSATWGDGVYRSTDGGKTFTKVLDDTWTVGDIVIHPDDDDTVFVAVLGNIWGDLGVRGLFKTTDGGESWRELIRGLPPGPSGKIGLDVSRSDPDVLMDLCEPLFQPALLLQPRVDQPGRR
jgi:photosystem II stability/assembly factor-like uncharacterized protein